MSLLRRVLLFAVLLPGLVGVAAAAAEEGPAPIEPPPPTVAPADAGLDTPTSPPAPADADAPPTPPPTPTSFDSDIGNCAERCRWVQNLIDRFIRYLRVQYCIRFGDEDRSCQDDPPLDPAEFSVTESVGQLTIRGAQPGQELLVTADDLNTWEGVADDDGEYIFHYLPAGENYTVTNAAQTEGVTGVTVLDRDSSTPEQSFYADQVIDEGFGYIETRDGTTLSAYVVLPGPVEDGPYPTVVEYSGYSPSDPISGRQQFADLAPFCNVLPTLCKAPTQVSSILAGLRGYAIVGVNVRGTGCSGGAYDYFDEAQLADGYDMIEAIAAQPWVKHNRVGMVGLSYPGIAQLHVARTQPPSLAAIAPLSVTPDAGAGVARPGGLINVGFATQWADQVRSNAAARGQGWEGQLIEEGDTECEANQELRNHGVDLVQRIRDNAYYTDEVAGPLDGRNFVPRINVPVYLTSQWQDEQTGGAFNTILDEFTGSPYARLDLTNGAHVDGYAPFRIDEWKAFLDIYVAQEVPTFNPLFGDVVAPLLYDQIFDASPTLPPSRWDGVTTLAEARAIWESEPTVKVTFESGAGSDEPGSPVGTFTAEFDSWPPPETQLERWYLQPDGSLGPALPPAAGGESSFLRNPDEGETTYYQGGSGGVFAALPPYDWKVETDGEHLGFISDPLADDLGLVGTASVDLWVKSTADNTDLEVLISEVRPDGSEMLVQTGVLDTEYRVLDPDESTALFPFPAAREEDSAVLEPDGWTQVRIATHAFAHVFRAGSRLRLVIDTPGGDEALWAYELPDRGDDVENRIAHDAAFPSSIALPVIPGLTAPGDPAPCPSLRGQPCRNYTP